MSEKIYPKIQIVDDKDNFLENVSYHEALARKAIRRASRIFVFNESGQILLQKRSKNIAKPLLFDQSAAGHVDEGETYYEAAVRELEEELGLKNLLLKEVVSSHRTIDFFSTVYTTVISDETEINFDKHEISEIFWYKVEEVDNLTHNNPEKCTPAFVAMWRELRDKLIK